MRRRGQRARPDPGLARLKAGALSPTLREPSANGIRFLYAAWFAYVGAGSPFLPLLYAHWGLGIVQIGLVASVSQVVRIATPPLWGMVADRAGHARALLLAGPLTMLAVLLALSQVPRLDASDRFLPVLALVSLLQVAGTGVTPLTEALALRVSGSDSGRYGRLRVWGSIGFLVAVLGAGPVLDRYGFDILPMMLAGILATLAVGCATMPARIASPGARHAPLTATLFAPGPIALMLSGFLMLASHGAFYGYFSLYLERLGYSGATIGALWALGVLAEIVLFLVQRRLFARFASSALLSASLATSVLRFLLTALAGAGLLAGSPLAFALLVLAQTLHAITFGLHHSASLRLLQQMFAPGQIASATAIVSAASYGAGGAFGVLVAGLVWQALGAAPAFAVASLFALAGVAVCETARRRFWHDSLSDPEEPSA